MYSKWSENMKICKEKGLNIVEIPYSHIEIYKGMKLIKIAYDHKAVNFYLKSLFKIK